MPSFQEVNRSELQQLVGGSSLAEQLTSGVQSSTNTLNASLSTYPGPGELAQFKAIALGPLVIRF